MGLALATEVAEVVLHGHDRLRGAHEMVIHGCLAGALDADDTVGEVDEQVTVGHRNTHQLGDDDGRQRIGELSLKIGAATTGTRR